MKYLGGKDKPAKTSSKPAEKKKVKVLSNGKNVGANFTREDAKNWKKEHDVSMSIRKIKRTGVKAKI